MNDRPVDRGGGGVKSDVGKPAMALMPAQALLEVGAVFAHGAKKYGVGNWEKGMEWRRMLSAALRHQFLWLAGEEAAEDNDQLHLAAACADLLMLLHYTMTSTGYDDRWKDW